MGRELKPGLTLILTGGRRVHVIGEAKDFSSMRRDVCEQTGQTLWSLVGLRSWTSNGETMPQDVVQALIDGAVSVEGGRASDPQGEKGA